MSAPAAKTVTRTPFKKWCDENVGLLFLIPWIIGFVVFKLYPFANFPVLQLYGYELL